MYIFGKQKNEQALSPETLSPGAGTSGETAQNGTATGNAGSAENGSANAGGGCYADEGTERESLAMVYSPRQYWRDEYTPAEALDRGTLFRELDKPLTGICPDGGGDRS